ncbi:MAG: acetyltransferase [Candidatus Saccharibacteria bacterium]|nr:acetyltransferase [Pseudorhodobacter sp.]
MPGDYRLRPMTRDDLAMVAGWLDTPDARQWWGDPAEQIALVTEDLDQPLMDQQVATLGDVPFGYLQSYPVHAWPDGAPHLHDFPPGTVAVDCFVGPTAMLGQGHGSHMLRLYCQGLFQRGATRVVIDPDPENERAVRAYRRAGFRDIALRRNGAGDMTLVMCFDPSS